MEWNTKSPFQWDWDHLFLCSAKATENPKLQPPNWSYEANGEINVLLDASGGSGCSGSELIHASSSRSSKSASINSSSNKDSKTSMFTFESSQDDSGGKKELSKEEPIENSHALEPSSVSGEPLLTLKLGKWLYFEDTCPGSGSKNQSSSSAAPVSSSSLGKKGRSNCQNVQHARCQVEGCGLDLSSAKDYHRKHRVCESHSKSPKVVIAGLERRFCQQCSRFHSLPEFDDKKRSCRRRLSDHNARRRKPHSEAVQFNQSALSSSSYVGRQQINPFVYSRTATNLVWQDMRCSKLPQTKDFLMKPAKPNNVMPGMVNMVSHDSNTCFASKGIATKTVNPGVEDSSITSSDPNASQDFQRALSLLSTNSWGSYETKSISLEHSNHTTQPVVTHAMSQARLPLASTEYWQTDQPQPVNSSMWITYPNCDDGNRFQEFQLFREPYEPSFPYDQLG